MQIVTGRTGEAHVTSIQDRALNQGLAGINAYILDTGEKLDIDIQTSNEIHIKDGALMVQGCLSAIEPGTYDTVTFSNGSQGMQRKDLVVCRYTYNAETQVEKTEWAVIQGTPAVSNPAVPSITNTGDIQSLDPIVDTGVFVATFNGVNLISVEPCIPTLKSASELEAEINAVLEELNGKINSANGKITAAQGDIDDLQGDFSFLTSTKRLWSGGMLMGADHTVSLSSSISSQPTGIILTFSSYTESSNNYEWEHFVVPKYTVSNYKNTGHRFNMFLSNFGIAASKYLTISNTQITGNAQNEEYGTGATGITFHNGRMVLRSVVGF